MSKKDYELIAEVIRSLEVSDKDKLHIARSFAHRLKADNERFSTIRFLEACEV